MSHSKPYFSSGTLSSLASPSLWPFAGWAALLHMSVIGGYIWQGSSPSSPNGQVMGSPVEIIYIEPTPPLASADVEPPKKTIFINAKVQSPLHPSLSTPKKDTGSVKEVEQIAFKKTSLLPQGGNPHPPYPEEAREKLIEGKVTVVLTVEAATGIVDQVEVISKSPAILVESVLATIKKWLFQPLGFSGHIIETVHFDFCLE